MLSRLEYDPSKNVRDMSYHSQSHGIATLVTYYMHKHDEVTVYAAQREAKPVGHIPTYVPTNIKDVFANVSDDTEKIYPITIAEVAEAQRSDTDLKGYFAQSRKVDTRLTVKVIDEVEVVVYDKSRLVIPRTLRRKVITWYHHYLMHPGHTRLEDTIAATMYWRTMRTDIRRHVKACPSYQKGKKRRRKYGKLPPKLAEVVPWRAVAVDLIGPYTLKAKDGTILDFMCLTMIDPATGWFEIVELPEGSVTVTRKGDEIEQIILDKSSAQISRLFNKAWLYRYPRSRYCIFDNGVSSNYTSQHCVSHTT